MEDFKLGIIDQLGEYTIWAVDQAKVKVLFDPDFTEGANGLARKYCPRYEVWISNTMLGDQAPFIIIHEFTEIGLMEEGMSYEDAHNIANAIEMACRRGELYG